MANLLRWIAPDTELGYNYTRIERSTSESGTYTELTSSDVPGYVNGSGLPFGSPTVTYARDETGTSSSWYRIRFWNGVSYSAYSPPLQAYDFVGYCTIQDVRQFTNLQDTEYTDASIQVIIDSVSDIIDLETNRTWSGVQTFTGYLDGRGTRYLDLHKGDIGSISVCNVDTNGNGTYATALTPGSDFFVYNDAGYLIMNPNVAPFNKWPNQYQAVQITFTWGNADPTPTIRQLALLMVANFFSVDKSRTAMIDKLISKNRRSTFDTPA